MATNNITATSPKINNYTYAPGIATYGYEGMKGATGEPGNAIFMTTYNIIDGEELEDFKIAIRNRKLPVKDGAVIPRDYQNGDLFFDTEGNIFRITDIDRMLSYPITSKNYKLYFMLVGKIKFTNSADRIFSKTASGKISLNADYSGLDINNTVLSMSTDNASGENYALRIFSDNKTSETGLVHVMQAKAFNDYTDIPELNIVYDSNINSWRIMSDIPVLIDQETKINNGTYETLAVDGYSAVITTPTPITNFVNICKGIRYTVNNNGSMIFTGLENMPADMQKNTRVHIKYKSGRIITEESSELAQGSNFINLNGITGVIYSVSFINNIECFIQEHPKK